MLARRRNQVLKGKHGGMQLLLTEDVPHLGKQGDLVEVKHGYGRNYLLPQGLATLPSPHNLKLLELHKKRVNLARESKIADLKALAEQIARVPQLTIEANAYLVPGVDGQPETHHLYGSVGEQDISKTLKGKNLKVEPEMVKLPGIIKQCGLYEIELHLGYEVVSKVMVMVVPLKQEKK
ncbi:MAG: 50S ribosomal protein L9 [Planctomycetes bacterium]|nr:50S ribosomal protein L9 [Planctomycetota bacterium]